MLLLTAEHQHCRAGDDQRPQHLQIFALQRRDSVAGLDRRQEGKRITVGMVQQRRAGHRQVGNSPGTHQIAKIDHALYTPVPLGITLPHHIVIGDIHVHRLPRQVCRQRLDMRLDLPGHLLQSSTLRQVGQGCQQVGDQCLRVARVPLQGARKARVLEICQREAHLPAQLTKAFDHGAAQVG